MIPIGIMLASCEKACPFEQATTKVERGNIEAGLHVSVDFKKKLQQLMKKLGAEESSKPGIGLVLEWLNNKQEETYWGSDKVEQFNLHTTALCSIYQFSKDANLGEEVQQSLMEEVTKQALELFSLIHDPIDTVIRRPRTQPPAPIQISFEVPAEMTDATISLDGEVIAADSGSTLTRKVILVSNPGKNHLLVLRSADRECRKRFAANTSSNPLSIDNCKKIK